VPKSFSWHLLDYSIFKTTFSYLFGIGLWIQKLLEDRKEKSRLMSLQREIKRIICNKTRVFGFVEQAGIV